MVHWVLDSWYEKENSATAKNELEVRNYPDILRRCKSKPYIVTHQIVNPQTALQWLHAQTFPTMAKQRKLAWHQQIIGKSFHDSCVIWKEQLPEIEVYHENSVWISAEEQEPEETIKKKAQSMEMDAIIDEDRPKGAVAGHLQCDMEELLEQQCRNVQHSDTADD